MLKLLHTHEYEVSSREILELYNKFAIKFRWEKCFKPPQLFHQIACTTPDPLIWKTVMCYHQATRNYSQKVTLNTLCAKFDGLYEKIGYFKYLEEDNHEL